MGKIFIGFYGWPEPEMKQDDAIHIMDEGFECWNLRKFSAAEFVEAIKINIPPVNDNVLRNYITESADTYGLSEEQYGQCLWGLLLPDQDAYLNGYGETLALLNLFSKKYMHPAFYVSHMGITKITKFNTMDVEPNDHQGYEQFKTAEFVSFYKAMIDQMKYFIWRRDIVTAWTNEDWRLFMASIFYSGLEEYQRSKTGFTWQRESTDMATLLETLFTAGDIQNEEIGYRLRKRVGVLIQWKFNEIEKELKELYNDRSKFVHGSFYKKIIRGMRSNPYDSAMLPSPDFEKLYKTKERIRCIFVAYLYLHKVMISGEEALFSGYTNVQQMLEDAVLNVELRATIIDVVRPIIALLPFEE